MRRALSIIYVVGAMFFELPYLLIFDLLFI